MLLFFFFFFFFLASAFTYPASSWFLLRQTREKPLRATVRAFEVTAVQRHGSRRGVTNSRMLGGKADGCSHWFPSRLAWEKPTARKVVFTSFSHIFLCFRTAFLITCSTILHSNSSITETFEYVPVAVPDFELRRGPSSILLAQPAFLPSVFSSFFTQNKGARSPDPSRRSATAF